jgi:hypothetical protein
MEESASMLAQHCHIVSDMHTPLVEKHSMQEEELRSLRAELYQYEAHVTGTGSESESEASLLLSSTSSNMLVSAFCNNLTCSILI